MGRLSDISTNGCCLDTTSLFLTVGMRIMVKPQGLEAITGVVRWLSGMRAGIEFDRPLYEPVVRHLVESAAGDLTVDFDTESAAAR